MIEPVALIFIIGILVSMVVGLGAVILEATDVPVAPAIRTCSAAFGASMLIWIAAMGLWSGH
ncbi:hypothetical protein [Streptomyces sp. NPDC048419]|uniref:hypothetical protein n=1 Tax=Streptomyces sp. NPDC048419 TaxID=3365547 RepID=UPI003714238E